jgi:phosphatidylglycerol:prolipoprotein diacylglycerol transferase
MTVHVLTDYLSLFVGFQLYVKLQGNSFLKPQEKMIYILGALAGALLGSRLLALLAEPALWHAFSWVVVAQNKTIIGGIAGGILGIEGAKKFLGIKRRTGDSIVMPLMVAIFIGRIGCEVAGVSDGTIGRPCDWAWCFSQGDALLRHPLPLYEMLALAVGFPFAYLSYKKKWLPEGVLFRFFIIGYFMLRFLLEFLKEGQALWFSLTAIQLVCLAVSLFYLYDVARTFLRVQKEVIS